MSSMSQNHHKNQYRVITRFVGFFMLVMMPMSCAFCVENTVHPLAEEHTTFCAQYIQKEQLVEAEARCQLAREYSPKFAEPVNLLGLIEHARGRKELAMRYFKESIALKNNFAEAHNNIGVLFMNERDYGAASDAFKEAIEIDPGYLDARINLATCHLQTEKLEDAKTEYLKCVQIDPNSCDCRIGMGVIALQKEDFQEAKTKE